MTDAAAAPAAADPGAAATSSAEAAAAAPGTTNPAAAPGGAAPDGQAPADAGASAVYRPEGLPDHLAGASERETLDKIWNAYSGFRRSESERGEKIGAVPDAPEKYAYQPADAVAAYLPNVADDPVFKVAQQAAHRHGLGDKQFAGFLNELMSGLVTGQMLDDPFSADKERAIVAGHIADPAARAKEADKVAQDTIAWLDAMVDQGKLPKDTADYAKGRTDRGHFLKLMQVMRQGAPTVAVGGEHGGGAITEEMIDQRMADPRNDTDSLKFSQSFREETQRMIERFEQQKAAAQSRA